MAPNLIALSIPVFFTLIGVELAAAHRLRRRLYRFGDAVSDLSAGVLSELSKLFLRGSLLAAYVLAYQYRLFDLSPSSPSTWALAFIGGDLAFYVWHRLSHEVNLLWAGHVVHHTSEDFNLAVALRQAIFTHATGIPFYLPLALAGVPPAIHVTAQAVNLLHQFWIHTELVGRLGPLEWVLNTPSHHRVHHAINPQYLDRNYGGTFIVWDRLFGTFAREREPTVYGTVKPLRSYDPVHTQVHYFGELARASAHARGLGGKLRVWFAAPSARVPGAPAAPSSAGVSRAGFVKYDPALSRAAAAYVFVQLVLALLAATGLIFGAAKLPQSMLALGAGLVLLALIGCAAITEGRRWAAPFEATRWCLTAATAVALWATR